MNVKAPYAYNLATSSFVKILSIKRDEFHYCQLDENGGLREETFATQPICSRHHKFVLPDAMDNLIDIFTAPIVVRSLNTGKQGLITSIDKRNVYICFEGCGDSSIPATFERCEKNVELPEDILLLGYELSRRPRYFFE